MSEKSDILLELDIFRDFYTEEIDIISEYFSIHKFFDLQVMMPQKSKESAFGIILDGEISIIDDHLDNPSRIPGDFLGEAALIQSNHRTADYIAASDGSIAIMTFDDINKLKQKHPQLAVKLIHIAAQSALKHFLKTDSVNPQDNIVLIADQNQGSNLIDFILKNQVIFSQFSLLTFPKLADRIQPKIQQKIQPVNPYFLVGGSNTMGSKIILGQVKAVISFKDPYGIPSSSSSQEALLRLCHLYQVLVGINWVTAQLILDSFSDG